jgi:hypothetical protein
VARGRWYIRRPHAPLHVRAIKLCALSAIDGSLRISDCARRVLADTRHRRRTEGSLPSTRTRSANSPWRARRNACPACRPSRANLEELVRRSAGCVLTRAITPLAGVAEPRTNGVRLRPARFGAISALPQRETRSARAHLALYVLASLPSPTGAHTRGRPVPYPSPSIVSARGAVQPENIPRR